MPDWRPSPFVMRAPDLSRGTMSVERKIASKAPGYDVVYRVYTPAGLAPDAKDLPSVYATDGSDYWRDDMGALVVVLDNLIASKSLPPEAEAIADAKRAKAVFESRGAEVGWLQPHDGHSWGHWRGSVDDVLVFLLGERREAQGERR